MTQLPASAYATEMSVVFDRDSVSGRENACFLPPEEFCEDLEFTERFYSWPVELTHEGRILGSLTVLLGNTATFGLPAELTIYPHELRPTDEKFLTQLLGEQTMSSWGTFQTREEDMWVSEVTIGATERARIVCNPEVNQAIFNNPRTIAGQVSEFYKIAMDLERAGRVDNATLAKLAKKSLCAIGRYGKSLAEAHDRSLFPPEQTFNTDSNPEDQN